MKITQTFQEPLDTDETPLSVSDLNPELLIKLLTSMYPNAGFSAFREYFANAMDATIVSGTTKPIEVTIPDASNDNTLTIKDYGTGMSPEKVEEISGKFRVSTKDEDNSLIGAFGLGSKTGIAYTDRYDVVTVQNGVKTTYYVSRTKNGYAAFPHLKIVRVEQTSEENSFEVKLKYRSGDFRGNYLHALAGFPRDKYVLTNFHQKLPVVDKENFFETTGITGDPVGWFRLVKNKYGNPKLDTENSTIDIPGGTMKKGIFYANVAGNIYPLYKESIPELSKKFTDFIEGKEVVLNVPNSSVDFVSSRDYFDYTPKTQQTITILADNFLQFTHDAVEEHLNENCTEDEDIINYARIWNQKLGMLYYQGEPVAVSFQQHEYPKVLEVGIYGRKKQFSFPDFLRRVTPVQGKVSRYTLPVAYNEASGNPTHLEQASLVLTHFSTICDAFNATYIVMVPKELYDNRWFRKLYNIREDAKNVGTLVERAREIKREKARNRKQTENKEKVSGYAVVTRNNEGELVVSSLAETTDSSKIVYALQAGALAINVTTRVPYAEKAVLDYWSVLEDYTVVALTARQKEEVFLKKFTDAKNIKDVILPVIQKEVQNVKRWSFKAAINNGQPPKGGLYGGQITELINAYDILVEKGHPKVDELESLKESNEMENNYSRYANYRLGLVDKSILQDTLDEGQKIAIKYKPLYVMLGSKTTLTLLDEEPAFLNAAMVLLDGLQKK